MDIKNIRNVTYQKIKATYGDDHVEYMVAVNFESKGLIWGWNNRSFIIESECGKFVDNYQTFDDAVNRQENFPSAYKDRYIRVQWEVECDEIIKNFKSHLLQKQAEHLSSTIDKIELL